VSPRPRVVVAGIGNEYRSDDGVGPVVAHAVAARAGAPGNPDPGTTAEVLAGIADPLDLLGRWDDAALAVIVDATRSGPPGTVTLVELSGPEAASEPPSLPRQNDPSPPTPEHTGGPSSTHGFGVVRAVRLARALGHGPARVVLVTVAGAAFGRGTGLSTEVAQAVPDAVALVLATVAAAQRLRSAGR